MTVEGERGKKPPLDDGVIVSHSWVSSSGSRKKLLRTKGDPLVEKIA